MNYKGKRVVVMGLGRFGGGIGVSRYFVSHGARVVVTDLSDEDTLKDSINQLSGLPVEYHLGRHDINDFTSCDLVVVNPAVNRRDNPYIKAAMDAGVPVTSEMRLLLQRLPHREHTIGVTGSAGKSTVTTMIGHILKRMTGNSRAHAGGNLGGSLLNELNSIGADDWVVLELSSFMLEDIDDIGWSPHIAVITSLSPNHLDRHDGFDAYLAAKRVILKHQHEDDKAYVGPGLRKLLAGYYCHVTEVDPETIPTIDLLLPGEHNKINACLAALSVAAALGCDMQSCLHHLRDYPGLPHRLQYVGRINTAKCYNDSKSTIPESAKLAISSFEAGRVHVILGGYDKGVDLTELAQFAAQRCRAIYTIGSTGPEIHQAACSAQGALAECVDCRQLDNAVSQAAARFQPDDVLLLSPGCASWDQFDNYEHRGETFISLINAMGRSQ